MGLQKPFQEIFQDHNRNLKLTLILIPMMTGCFRLSRICLRWIIDLLQSCFTITYLLLNCGNLLISRHG